MFKRTFGSNSPAQLITSALLKSEYERFDSELENIVNKSAQLGGNAEGFYYNGRVFIRPSMENYKSMYTTLIRLGASIDESLIPELVDYLKRRAKVQTQEKKILQILSICIAKADQDHTQERYQALRNYLPDYAYKVIPDAPHKDRTLPEGFCFMDNPTLKDQFDKAVYLIEYFIGNKLVH